MRGSSNKITREQALEAFSHKEDEYKGIMSRSVYLIIAQYDDHERMWKVVNTRSTFQEARITKKAHESETDCSYVDVYVAREMTDKELD